MFVVNVPILIYIAFASILFQILAKNGFDKISCALEQNQFFIYIFGHFQLFCHSPEPKKSLSILFNCCQLSLHYDIRSH